jgi:hypothetical protein
MPPVRAQRTSQQAKPSGRKSTRGKGKAARGKGKDKASAKTSRKSPPRNKKQIEDSEDDEDDDEDEDDIEKDEDVSEKDEEEDDDDEEDSDDEKDDEEKDEGADINGAKGGAVALTPVSAIDAGDEDEFKSMMEAMFAHPKTIPWVLNNNCKRQMKILFDLVKTGSLNIVDRNEYIREIHSSNVHDELQNGTSKLNVSKFYLEFKKEFMRLHKQKWTLVRTYIRCLSFGFPVGLLSSCVPVVIELTGHTFVQGPNDLSVTQVFGTKTKCVRLDVPALQVLCERVHAKELAHRVSALCPIIAVLSPSPHLYLLIGCPPKKRRLGFYQVANRS